MTSAMAVVLFGDRIGPGVLAQQGTSRSLQGDEPTTMDLLTLADTIGLRVVAARA